MDRQTQGNPTQATHKRHLSEERISAGLQHPGCRPVTAKLGTVKDKTPSMDHKSMKLIEFSINGPSKHGSLLGPFDHIKGSDLGR